MCMCVYVSFMVESVLLKIGIESIQPFSLVASPPPFIVCCWPYPLFGLDADIINGTSLCPSEINRCRR
ncbi:Hypothetical predicted protein [Octopus vulgaris]|uniref:Uncharacterized protein n=1 Tax=Octopus vulgaris TaxID=6645 RepID=A0AA36F017_OCTVU|nr:Hypothetical predicted protein [Octopus vulgaris]